MFVISWNSGSCLAIGCAAYPRGASRGSSRVSQPERSGGGQRTRAKARKSMRVNSPRETEVTRNQITSSSVANSKGRILKEHTKNKSARYRSQGTRSRCPCLLPLPPSRFRIFCGPRWQLQRVRKRNYLGIPQLASSNISEIDLLLSHVRD
jgi:hypothetical protein